MYTRRTGMLALLTVGAALQCPVLAEPEEPPAAAACGFSPEALENAGARIGKLSIHAENIFDLDDPAEDNALFRTMNRLHVRTRDGVIARQLLFGSGDAFRVQQLDESERLLRSTAYLYDADIRIAACDAQSVDLEVHTRDVWTLKPGFSLSRSGGESRVGFDLQEDNFLGRGGSVRYVRRIDEERRSTEIGYADRNLGGRWISLDATVADNSDGHELGIGLERPFYALDSRWALGARILDRRLEDPVYSLGDEIGRFREDVEHLDIYGGWSNGLQAGWVQRWLAGVVYDRRRFANADGSIDPALIPEDRKLLYPFVEYQLIEDRFQRAANLDQIYVTEDVSLGASIGLRLGLLSETLGADRRGATFGVVARRGYGDPLHVLWDFSAHASGRLESGEITNAIVGGTASWYLRQSERRLLFAAVRGDVAENLDLDNPLELGGDNGLRGYPLRYQRGDARAQFTIEQRYFTDYYLWRLFRVGGAIFFDAGRVWGENPYGGENLGWLRDVGFGLRLGSTRSSIGRVVHIDLAFPLDGDASIDSVQFLVQGKRSF
ncbi:MAG TPA: hypothetical protein PLS34_00875 [Gammaproteobacteria bacterium]|nr:hypothetical protein [Gammaproteobacteria bacterium]